VSIANPLLGPFASKGMPTIDIVVEPDQDPILSNGPTRSDPYNRHGTHYIDPFFCYELKKIVDFEVRLCFKWNYRVVIPSSTDTVDNSPSGCIAVYLEALKHGLRFSLLKVIMKIL